MLKKVLLSFVISSLFFSVSFASNYNSPIMDGSIQFKAKLENGKVYTKWTRYNKNEGFKYYKIIKSQTVANPVYPENGYIKYSSDINFLSYTDNSVKDGTNYYRVCAITKESNRYCSNVVKTINYKQNNYTDTSNSYHNTNNVNRYSDNNLSTKLKNVADSIINKFISGLERKKYSDSKKIAIINSINLKLNDIKKSKPKLRNVVEYMIRKLNNQLNKYNELSDLESIFNNY